MQSDDLGLVERLKKAAKPIKVFAGVSSRGAVYRTDKPLHAALLTEAAKALAAKDAAIERLVAENRALIEALKPFAEYMGDSGDLDNKGRPLPGDQGVGWVYLTQADFRRARQALGDTL